MIALTFGPASSSGSGHNGEKLRGIDDHRGAPYSRGRFKLMIDAVALPRIKRGVQKIIGAALRFFKGIMAPAKPQPEHAPPNPVEAQSVPVGPVAGPQPPALQPAP